MTARICAHCGEQFDNITDHLTHVVQQHDTGFKPKERRTLLRSSSCWSCAAEIQPTETHCACGALSPRLR